MNEQLRIGLLLAGAAAIAIAAVWLVIRIRRTPQDPERKRRLDVNARGRLLDGMVTDATAETIYYSYSIAGMCPICHGPSISLPRHQCFTLYGSG